MGLPSEEEIDELKPSLIIIDDLMTELGNNKSLTNIIYKKKSSQKHKYYFYNTKYISSGKSNENN